MTTSSKVARNILGFIAGLAAAIAVYLLANVFFGFILSVGWLATLLSWPSSPILYVTTGSGAAAVFTGMAVSSFICAGKRSKGKKKFGTMALGVVILLYFGIVTVVQLQRGGLTDWAIGYALTALMGILVIKSGQ